jgi:hypothetical protein
MDGKSVATLPQKWQLVNYSIMGAFNYLPVVE